MRADQCVHVGTESFASFREKERSCESSAGAPGARSKGDWENATGRVCRGNRGYSVAVLGRAGEHKAHCLTELSGTGWGAACGTSGRAFRRSAGRQLSESLTGLRRA